MKKYLTPRNLVILVSALVLAAVGTTLALRHPSDRTAIAAQEEAQALYHPETETEAQETESETESIPEDMFPEEMGLKVQDDFLELYEANPDLVGWLKAGETIDYPVVQKDNDYYLTHAFNQNPDANGTLFVNMGNTLVPRDDVILIHGHHMASGLMFGTLSRFEEAKYGAEHPLITFRTIYDPEDVYYTPIAVFNASMIPGNYQYFDVTQILFEDDEPVEGEPESSGRKSTQFQNYLDELKKWSLWESKVDVNVEDQLLMLITCSYYQDDGRLMVVCRALRSDETPESITALYAE